MATTSAKTKSPKRAAACSVPAGEPVPVIKGSHVYLIDGSGYIFRAFHALPPLTRPSDGLPVGAVHGFCAMLWKLLQDARKGERADAPGRHLRRQREDVPQRDLQGLQGAPPAGARGARSPVPADPRRGQGLQHRLHRAGRLRGRRPDRHLRQAGGGGRRRHDHRVLRQRHDAADPARHRHARHHEEPHHRSGRGARAVRRAARQGRRRTGAGRRFRPTTCRAFPASASRRRRS